MGQTIRYITILLFFWNSHAYAQAMSNSQEYKSCTALTRADPSKALIMADEWSRTSNAASAFHCRAIALFALKRYTDAGKALNRLSDRVGSSNLMLWANVLRQSARAWELGGDKAQALIALTKAIQPISQEAHNNANMARLASELLSERSRIYAESGRNLFAIQDLDQAVALYSDDEKLLLARAKLFIEMHDHALAEKDLKIVMIKQPNNAVASRLLKALRVKN